MSNVFNLCPRCSVDLPSGATSCVCGWKKRGSRPERKAREPVQCAHDGCAIDATIRMRLPTGWGSVCRPHAERHWQEEADDFCTHMDLDTRAKQHGFVKEKLAAFKQRSFVAPEPGDGDEERVT